MYIKKEKIVIKILKILMMFFIIFFVFFTVSFIFDFFVFGFKKMKNNEDKYEVILNKNYYSNINPSTFWSAIGTGNCFFYKYKNNELCIMELKQYSELNIFDIAIKDYLLNGENKNFSRLKTTIYRNEKSYLIIDLYPKFKKVTKFVNYGNYFNIYFILPFIH